MTILRTGTAPARARASGLLTAAAGVLVWLVAAPGQPAAMRSDDAGQAVVPRQHSFACMDADGDLMMPVGTDCGPRQTVVPLNSSNAEGCKNNPWDPAEESDPSGEPPAEVKLNEIEKILRATENAAIFEVVDRDGRPIFQVLPCEIAMSNTAEERVITLNASETGGFLTATNQAMETISLGTAEKTGGVLIAQDGRNLVEYGKQPGGNFSLRFPSALGPAAALGESLAGTGALVIGDDLGRPRGLISLSDGRGRVMIENKDGSPVLSLMEGESGSGMLVIGDSSSEPMVKFSVTDNRYGAVLAGPVSGLPAVPGSGLPGSYILGCAGGPSCGPGGGGPKR